MTATGRFAVLDGWRGLSILFVLAAHFLPLGPKAWRLNDTAGPLGMSLFFALSGFLITHFLLHRPGVREFLIRRLSRIVPLAWVGIAAGLWLSGAGTEAYLPHYLFYANLPPIQLATATSHIWSLCVEMQFYLGIALLVALLRERGLALLPWLCAGVTALRIAAGEQISIVTWFRVDEILAGAVLALVYNERVGARLRALLRAGSPLLLFLLLIACCHPESGAANYLRPYAAAALVGATLLQGDTALARFLANRVLAYVAAISYALYVLHPLFGHTWLGSGEGWEKYLKRPLLFAVVFAAAHLSTFHFENRWIALGRRLAASPRPA